MSNPSVVVAAKARPENIEYRSLNVVPVLVFSYTQHVEPYEKLPVCYNEINTKI